MRLASKGRKSEVFRQPVDLLEVLMVNKIAAMRLVRNKPVGPNFWMGKTVLPLKYEIFRLRLKGKPLNERIIEWSLPNPRKPFDLHERFAPS